MASPNSTFTEIVTTTLRNHPSILYDNVSNHNALWARLHSKGNVKSLSGGYEIVEPLEYAENASFQRYSGYEQLNIQASDVFSAAKFDWKQAATHITASGLELRQNSGKEQLINLATSRINNAKRTMANNLSSDIYSSGTASGGKQMGGLQHIVSDAGTGTVGGIDSSTYTFWQSTVQSAAAPLQGGGSITPSSSTIKSLMNPLWLELVRGADKPDLIVSSNEYFTYFWESLQDLQRYGNNEDPAMAGFASLKYVTADVIHDGGSGIPDAHMYFLNTDYLYLKVHRDANMTVMDEKMSTNQDATVIPVLFQGNLTCSNRSLQGVVKA